MLVNKRCSDDINKSNKLSWGKKNVVFREFTREMVMEFFLKSVV